MRLIFPAFVHVFFLFFFFFQHFNYVFVAINGDGSETEEDLMRKLHVFGRIVGLLYGPVINK